MVAGHLEENLKNNNLPGQLGTGFTIKKYSAMLEAAGITAAEMGFAFNKIVDSLLESATLITGDRVRASDTLKAVIDVTCEWEIGQVNRNRIQARILMEARNRARDAARASLFPAE